MNDEVTLPSSTDIVIIGGGIMGTSTAFFLTTETNRDVTVIEKSAIAAGSTGDSSAILRHHYGSQKIYSKMAWWSHQFYRNFEEETGEALAHADNPLVRFGYKNTQSGTYAEDGHDVLSSLGIPVTQYRSDELSTKYPMVDSVNKYDIGVSDDAAGYADGTDAANGFARAARRNGATVITGTEVESATVDEDVITEVETADGSITCDTVVVAAGPWTSQFGTEVGLKIPITTTREQVCILDPPEEYNDSYSSPPPTTSLPDGEWYMRPDFGDGILVATHHTGEEVDVDQYNQTPDDEIILKFAETVPDMIPKLRDAEIKGQYCGIYSTTPDHDFIIDQAGPENCYFVCGFSGHGFKHGPAVGKITTDLITDGDTSLVDAEFFSFNRFEDDSMGHD